MVKVGVVFWCLDSTVVEENVYQQIVDQNPNLTLVVRTMLHPRVDVEMHRVSRFVKPFQRRAISTN